MTRLRLQHRQHHRYSPPAHMELLCPFLLSVGRSACLSVCLCLSPCLCLKGYGSRKPANPHQTSWNQSAAGQLHSPQLTEVLPLSELFWKYDREEEDEGHKSRKTESWGHSEAEERSRGHHLIAGFWKTPSIPLPPVEGYSTYSQECGRQHHNTPSPSRP